MEKEKAGSYETEQIDLFQIMWDCFARFRQIWFLLFLLIALCAAGNIVKEHFQYQESYEASASFVVTAGGKEYTDFTVYYNKVTMEQLSATFPHILTSGVLHNIVANDLGMKHIPGVITANVVAETNLFQIKVESADAQMSYDILQSVIKNYPKVAKYVLGDTELSLIDESGVPKRPVSMPDYVNAGIKGILIGVMISFLILLAQVLMRHTVKNQEDIKAFLNIKYLVGIPKIRAKKRSKKKQHKVLLEGQQVPPVFKEAIHTLQIRFTRVMKEKNYKTLVITSALPGEGKTTVSCNLAFAMAKKGYKVLLIDGDFRNPSVAQLLELSNEDKGIVDVLQGTVPADEVIQQYHDMNLWILSGTKAQNRVSKLYRSGSLKELVEKYEKEMDYIIIDTPPCAMMNDAALAADCADAVLLVIRQDYAHRQKIQEGVEVLDSSRAALIGCVINGEEVGSGSYGKYGYGKYGYGKYGYGKYGYGKYGYGSYGYGGYGYGADIDESDERDDSTEQ